MRRSVLLSTLVIGAVIAVLAAVGTQATFTDTQQASGDVNAAGINLYLSDVTGADDTGEDEAIFNASAENLLPGQTASWTIKLRNVGTSAFDVTADSSGSTGLDCDGGGPDFSIAVSTASDNGGDNHGVAHIAPEATAGPIGGTEDVKIDVTLAAAATNACQGDVANIVVDFDATQH
jgi:hypothetical protein